jgi:hypothetical protein
MNAESWPDAQEQIVGSTESRRTGQVDPDGALLIHRLFSDAQVHPYLDGNVGMPRADFCFCGGGL